MTTDLNTLLTALYVKIDDHLGKPARHGRPPRLTDAELLTLAVAQALLGIRSEARWLRFLPRHLPGARPFPRDSETLRAGRMGRLRLPRQPLPVLLGSTAAPDPHPGRAPDQLGIGQPEAGRTPSPHGRARPRPECARRPTRPTDRRRQGYVSRELDGYLTEHGVRLLALTAAIRHNRATSQPTTRSLTAYDH